MPTALHGVDLHMHTRYSDGLDTPTRLVQKAAQQGLRHIAITDHDTVEALVEAQQAGHDYQVEVLTGVELSVQYQDYHDIHILGYLFDPEHASVQMRLQRLQDCRVQRGLEILSRVNQRLTQAGCPPLERERVWRRVHGALTRPHLAQELIEQGHADNVEQAFRDFLIPCDVPKAALHPEDAFELIAQAGGVCSWAHPGTVSTDANVLETLLDTFKAMGLTGVEVYHHAHYPTYVDFFLMCTRRYGLMATGGSDYHGRENGAVLGHMAPGQPIPDDVLIDLRRMQQRKTLQTRRDPAG